ncbi:hypothetical protein BUH_7580 [Burkholderia pseudomallei Pakistan 9]|nr:hypothetical protein BUH_7580 [Burkholderia pseudomallei Pakistan 9]
MPALVAALVVILLHAIALVRARATQFVAGMRMMLGRH